MNHKSSCKKRQEQIITKTKSVKNWKLEAEQSLPFSVRSQKVPSQTKKLIFQMEQQYIKRYNILISNRTIYASIIQSMASSLDQRGIVPEFLKQYFKTGSIDSNEQRTAAE